MSCVVSMFFKHCLTGAYMVGAYVKGGPFLVVRRFSFSKEGECWRGTVSWNP